MSRASSPDEFFLDPRAVRRAFDAAAATFDGFAIVHAEIRARLLERLDVVRLNPALVVDLGAATGHASRALKDRYPEAQVLAVDLSARMLVQARRRLRLFRKFHRVAADAQQLPLRDGSVDLICSNLMLQWCNDPDAVFSEARRVMRPNALLTFASLGPDSLREIREAWSRIDAHVHVHRFIDMHDLGDALVRAGFAEPVMDSERLTITYPTADALRLELSRTGSTNQAAGRRTGLSGSTIGHRFRQALDERTVEGKLPVTLEIVYGHAWSAAPQLSGRQRAETLVPFRSIGRR